MYTPPPEWRAPVRMHLSKGEPRAHVFARVGSPHCTRRCRSGIPRERGAAGVGSPVRACHRRSGEADFASIGERERAGRVGDERAGRGDRRGNIMKTLADVFIYTRDFGFRDGLVGLHIY